MDNTVSGSSRFSWFWQACSDFGSAEHSSIEVITPTSLHAIMDKLLGMIALDRRFDIRVSRITDNPSKLFNIDRLSLQHRAYEAFGPSIKQKLFRLWIDSSNLKNHMINHAKRRGCRIPFAGVLRRVYCMLSCCGWCMLMRCSSEHSKDPERQSMFQINGYIVFKQPAGRVQLRDDYGHVCTLSLCLCLCVSCSTEKTV
jgi:hypothetical protein